MQGFVYLAVLIAGLYWFGDWNSSIINDDRITSYGVMCNSSEPQIKTTNQEFIEAVRQGECIGYETPIQRTDFRINFARSEATMISDPGDSQRMVQLANCTIFNSDNWKCFYKDGSGPIEIKNGVRKIECSSLPPITCFRFVSKWRWRFKQIGALVDQFI